MSVDILRRLPVDTLKAEKVKATAAGNSAFADQLGAALTAKGYVEGEPDPGCPGLTRRKVYLDSDGLNVRPAYTYEGDILSWLSPFMSHGARGHINREMVLEEKRGGRLETILVRPGERAVAVKR